MNELFPYSDTVGESMWIDNTEIVAFDLNGERYCVECAKQMDEIDCERFHHNPYSVPSGGSVPKRSLYYGDMEYHCGNHDCGKKIPDSS